MTKRNDKKKREKKAKGPVSIITDRPMTDFLGIAVCKVIIVRLFSMLVVRVYSSLISFMANSKRSRKRKKKEKKKTMDNLASIKPTFHS